MIVNYNGKTKAAKDPLRNTKCFEVNIHHIEISISEVAVDITL